MGFRNPQEKLEKVRKFQYKTVVSPILTPKNNENNSRFCALGSKKWLNQKYKTHIIINWRFFYPHNFWYSKILWLEYETFIVFEFFLSIHLAFLWNYKLQWNSSKLTLWVLLWHIFWSNYILKYGEIVMIDYLQNTMWISFFSFSI